MRSRERGSQVEDARFDRLTRRVAGLSLPSLPRRALVAMVGSAALAGGLGSLLDPELAAAKKNRKQGASAQKKKNKKKCKKEGKKCDKKKCKKQDKKCCCKNLKCKNDVCEGEGCPTNADFNTEWDEFDADGPDTFNLPWGIAVDPDGTVYVTDTNNERVLAFNQNGTNLINQFGQAGEGGNNFDTPRGIGFNENNQGDDRLVVTDPEQNANDDTIRRFNGDPDAGDDFGDLISAIGNEAGNNIEPYGVAIDPDDRIWVVNRVAPGQVFLFNRDGDLIADFEPDFSSPGPDSLSNPQGIAVFEDDNNDVFVYVADTDNNRVVKFEYVSNDFEDGLDYISETDDSGNDELDSPIGLAVDSCSNVWVADSSNDRVAVFDKNLEFVDEITQNFNLPTGVALGPDGDDTLYVVDSDNARIVKFDLS